MALDPLSLKLQALSDPTRRAILARLISGQATVNELAHPFQLSLPAISKHIKVLEVAGLITRTRHAQQRPCQLSAEGLREVDDWLNAYRATWEQRLDRLEAYLETLQEK
ncbi:MAG: winged helix-turn-helix transcriptional regulator [Alphaproteobacteria bacterium]|nr:winged helix-turn-helix transcriptional regulator [Alphaproteobacteria bacterium]